MTPDIVLIAFLSYKPPKPVHKFYDKPAKIELVTAITLAAADSALTCNGLAHGIQEGMLPTQSCGKVNLLLFGQVAVQEGVTYFLHRTGHHKIERIARFVTIGANTRGIVEWGKISH